MLAPVPLIMLLVMTKPSMMEVVGKARDDRAVCPTGIYGVAVNRDVVARLVPTATSHNSDHVSQRLVMHIVFGDLYIIQSDQHNVAAIPLVFRDHKTAIRRAPESLQL